MESPVRSGRTYGDIREENDAGNLISGYPSDKKKKLDRRVMPGIAEAGGLCH
jgi:hypothetical protein